MEPFDFQERRRAIRIFSTDFVRHQVRSVTLSLLRWWFRVSRQASRNVVMLPRVAFVELFFVIYTEMIVRGVGLLAE